MSILVCIRGGGDLGSGTALRLFHSGINVCICELPTPLVVRRTVAFAEAIFSGSVSIEGVSGRVAIDVDEINAALAASVIPVVSDPDFEIGGSLKPDVVVDARLLKQSLNVSLTQHPMVIGLGPGFMAGKNCHAVVETKRGHTLGRVIWEGTGEPDSGLPENVMGFERERVIRAPESGIFNGIALIGQKVFQGDLIASVGEVVIKAPLTGIVRGMLATGVKVDTGMKVGDIDPRDENLLIHLVSDKALAVGGGVLEAILGNLDLRKKIYN